MRKNWRRILAMLLAVTMTISMNVSVPGETIETVSRDTVSQDMISQNAASQDTAIQDTASQDTVSQAATVSGEAERDDIEAAGAIHSYDSSDWKVTATDASNKAVTLTKQLQYWYDDDQYARYIFEFSEVPDRVVITPGNDKYSFWGSESFTVSADTGSFSKACTLVVSMNRSGNYFYVLGGGDNKVSCCGKNGKTVFSSVMKIGAGNVKKDAGRYTYLDKETDAEIPGILYYGCDEKAAAEYSISYDDCTLTALSASMNLTGEKTWKAVSFPKNVPTDISSLVSSDTIRQFVTSTNGILQAYLWLPGRSSVEKYNGAVTANTDALVLGNAVKGLYYAAKPLDYSGADKNLVWNEALAAGTLKISGLQSGTGYHIMVKKPAVTTGQTRCFPAYAESTETFTTGVNRKVTITPRLKKGISYYAGDKPQNSDFTYSLQTENGTAEEFSISGTPQYYVDGKKADGTAVLDAAGPKKITADIAGLTVTPAAAYSSNTYKLTAAEGSMNVLNAASAPVITGNSGTYYYGSASENAPFSVTIDGSADTSAKVYFALSEDNIIKNHVDLTTVSAGETVYAQACSAKGVASGIVSFQVAAMPLKLTCSYNFYSKAGDSTYDTACKTTILDAYVTVRDGYDNVMELKKIQSVGGFIYADVSYVSISEGAAARQNYALKPFKLKEPYNYYISNAYGEYYYVFPKFTADFKSTATNRIVSASQEFWPDAAKNIDSCRTAYRVSSPCWNYDRATFTFPVSSSEETSLKKLAGWSIAGNGYLYDKGGSIYIGSDMTFYAVYDDYSEDPAHYGSLSFSGITEAQYTGRPIVTVDSSQKNATRVLNLVIRQTGSGVQLNEGTDYTVTYKNNIKAYTGSEDDADFKKKAPQLTVRFKGSYRGAAPKTFYFGIAPYALNYYQWHTVKYVYKENTKASSVKFMIDTYMDGKWKPLRPGKDFTFSVNGKAADEKLTPGYYSINFTGINNYSGIHTAYNVFCVLSEGTKASPVRDMSKLKVKLIKKEYDYSGIWIRPEYKVYDGNTDVTGYFTCSYDYNMYPGKVKAVIYPASSGIYKGSRTVNYTIRGRKFAGIPAVSVPFTGNVTSGTAISLLKVTADDGTALSQGNDYIINAAEADYTMPGKKTLLITGYGEFTGQSRKVTYTVEKVTADDVIWPTADYILYARQCLPLQIKLKSNSADIGNSGIFRYSFKNAGKAAGKADIVITPVAKYASGKAKILKDITVTPQQINYDNIFFNFVAGTDPAKAAKMKMLVLKDMNGNVLQAGTDYNYEITESAGTATVTIKDGTNGHYIYAGMPVTKKVLTADLRQAKVAFADKHQGALNYTGNQQYPPVTVRLRDGTEVPAGQYKVECINNIYPGTATLKVHGITGGDYGEETFYAGNALKFRIK